MNSNAVHSTSKQGILKRMLRFATKHSGVKHIELLDPLTTLFIESLAEEIYTASSEISNIESRMLDTLAGIIAPDKSLSAHPAHCILHAMPVEGEMILSKDSAFILKNRKQLPGRTPLTFYPIYNTAIRKASIRYLVYNGLCYQIETDSTKTLISRSRNIEPSSKRCFRIGLQLDESVHNLKNLSFYFDFFGASNKKELLNLLPYSIWKLDGKTLKHKQGLNTLADCAKDETVELFKSLTTTRDLDKSISDLYDKHFLTIEEDIDILSQKKQYPDELKDSFPAHILEDFKENLLWLEIEFPSKFNTVILETISVSINAFPVANKSLHSKTVEIHESLSVIPLDTGNHESLLSIHSVTDSQGRIYYELPFEDTLSEQFCTYSLRRGGYERYSKREMREYLLELIKQMESHSATQAQEGSREQDEREETMIGVHKLTKHIKEIIAKTKEKLEIQNYILIDRLEKSDVFFIKYWTTYCEQANNIKQNTALDSTDTDILLDTSSIFTLSATLGGKYAPQITERQNLQIKAITDRTVLVTHDDIINYCNTNFGTIISHVKVAKGIMPNPDRKEEFIRTTDVILTTRKELGYLLSDSEISFLKKNLQRNSLATFNYRIIINDEKLRN